MNVQNLPEHALETLHARLWERTLFGDPDLLRRNRQHWYRIRQVYNRVCLERNKRMGERIGWK